jgi:hypothetical protein
LKNDRRPTNHLVALADRSQPARLELALEIAVGHLRERRRRTLVHRGRRRRRRDEAEVVTKDGTVRGARRRHRGA